VRASGGLRCLRHEQRAEEEPVPWQLKNPGLAVVIEAAEPQAGLFQWLAVDGVEAERAVERLDRVGALVEAGGECPRLYPDWTLLASG
jgi:hypothetical protein